MNRGQSSSGTQLLIGYLAAFGSIVSSMFSGTCVQALQGAIPDFQLSTIRSTMQGLAFVIGGLIVTTDFTVKREYVPGLIYYGVIYCFFNVGFYGATAYLPLPEVQGTVTIVSFVFSLGQSNLLFNNDVAKSIIVASLVCVVGIVLVAQPAWMFNKMPPTSDAATIDFNNTSSTLQPLDTSMNYAYIVSKSEVMLGYTLSILGGAAQGLIFDINGIILHGVKTIPKAIFVMLVCTVGSVAFMFYFEDPVSVIDLVQFGLEMVTMLICQYTIMHSIKPGNYNWIEVFGCIIVLFGASIPGVMDILAHKAKANELP